MILFMSSLYSRYEGWDWKATWTQKWGIFDKIESCGNSTLCNLDW